MGFGNLFKKRKAPTKQAGRWMSMEKWDACDFAVNEADLEGRVCYGGLDLSSTADIAAFVLVFPPMHKDDKYIVLPFFWIPGNTIDYRMCCDHVPYDVWEQKGYIKTTEGTIVHYGYIAKFIKQLRERFNIRDIAFDHWGPAKMVQNLEDMGFTVVPFGYSFRAMSPSTKKLMELTIEQKIAHGGNTVLQWMMSNVRIRTNAMGEIKADKENSPDKINGVIATIMALDRATHCENNAMLMPVC